MPDAIVKSVDWKYGKIVNGNVLIDYTFKFTERNLKIPKMLKWLFI